MRQIICMLSVIVTNVLSLRYSSAQYDNDDVDELCGLYLAESMLESGRLALYAGNQYAMHQPIAGDQEIVIPIVNANKNEYSPWHDFVWSPSFIPDRVKQPESEENYLEEYFISGLSAIAPCSSVPNVRPNYSKLYYDSYRNGEQYHADPDSISHFNGFGTSAVTSLEAGELLINHCDDYLQVPEGRLVQSMESLRSKGVCVDTLEVQESTIGGIGRGAFAKYFSRTGDIVATTPLIHFDRSQINIVEQSYKDVHRIPLFREHGIEYTSKVTGQQHMLNYCYGHPDSNLLLLPYGPGVNFINHHKTEANVYIRWSVKLGDSSEYREKTPLTELYEQPASGKLMMEFVALKDILPGDEVFLDYGPEFANAWNQHINGDSDAETPFRHEIGVPPGFYIDQWMRADPKPFGDFIPSPLAPGHVAPIRWAGTAEVVTPWAFRIGLPRRVRKVLLHYCDKMGITDILRHVTLEGNALKPGTETHIELEGDDWYLQRPESFWRSNMHWFSPGAGPAHEHYLQALSVAGFDEVLNGIGEYLGMDGLVAFHVTFIAVSFSNKGFMHYDVMDTGAKVFNIIVPLLLANETGPELDLRSWKPDLPSDTHAFREGRYRYEYEVASLMGDDAVHGTSACDYRKNHEMRIAATVYVADMNDLNAASIMKHYTQAYPPSGDIDLLKSWKGRHWKKGDHTRKLPKPSPDHLLVREGWTLSQRRMAAPEPVPNTNTTEHPSGEL
jgi:SET domain